MSELDHKVVKTRVGHKLPLEVFRDIGRGAEDPGGKPGIGGICLNP